MKKIALKLNRFFRTKTGIIAAAVICTGILISIPLLKFTTFFARMEGEPIITDYQLPNGGSDPNSIIAGQDGNLWFTAFVYGGNGEIGKITTGGNIDQRNVFSGQSGPTDIALGQDGKLWFTEYDGQKIGSITTDFILTEYSIPDGGSPLGITTGPDGNLWYTDDTGKIGKISTAGEYTIYPLTEGVQPQSITTGPDNNLWFTELQGNIGRITTSGQITEFPAPTNTGGITSGPDGNLWFTETQNGSVGKISTTGSITRYPAPQSCESAGCIARDITSGPDGNLWFTIYSRNNTLPGHIVRITPEGIMTEYEVTRMQPVGITTGPDGNIWFTYGGGSAIGRVNLSAITPSSTPTPNTESTPTMIPSPTEAVTPSPGPSAKTPVILIPGIFGSEFEVKQTFDPGIKDCVPPYANYEYVQGDKVWLDINNLGRAINRYKICDTYLDVLSLQQNGQNPIYPSIGLKGTVVNDSAPGTNGNIGYRDLIRLFDNDANYQLYIYPYDWRKDLSSNIDNLNTKIDSVLENTTPGTKVNIIAHSMGGLIARDYISVPQRAEKVKTIVEIGTPHVGTPTFLAHLLYNKCVKWIDIPFAGDTLRLDCAINGNEVNKLAQNFPGAYQLLPSRKYYTLYPYLYPFKDDSNMDNDSATSGALSYDQTKTLLTNLNKNMTIFNTAENYHDALDSSYTNTNGVNFYMIAGSGQPTIGQIRDYNGINLSIFGLPQLNFVRKQDAVAVNGDDSVPLYSATLWPSETTAQNNVYYVNQSHKDLPAGNALQMAYNLINEQTSNIPGVSSLPFNFSGKIIGIYSPAVLHAYDNLGNHTGPKADGTIEVSIPGSSYDELGESKFIYLPDGGSYNLKTKAIKEGSFDLKIKTYVDSDQTKEQLYLTVPQTANTTTSMTLNTDSPILQVDTDSNGTVDQSIPASSTITGSTLNDTQAPTTTTQATGTLGSNGWYKSNVLLTLTASDTGSGVLKKYYYFDGEQTLREYTAPVTISTEKINKIGYFSVDKAGNTEQPKFIDIKIDKTAPELVMQFDPNVKQIKGSGEDTGSGIDTVAQTTTGLTVKDKAGNNSQYIYTTKNWAIGKIINQTINITSLKYNGITKTIPKTILTASWTVNSSSAITYLLQTYAITKQEGIVALYDAAKSKTTALTITKGSKTTKTSASGLVIIKLKSNNGKLSLIY